MGRGAGEGALAGGVESPVDVCSGAESFSEKAPGTELVSGTAANVGDGSESSRGSAVAQLVAAAPVVEVAADLLPLLLPFDAAWCGALVPPFSRGPLDMTGRLRSSLTAVQPSAGATVLELLPALQFSDVLALELDGVGDGDDVASRAGGGGGVDDSGVAELARSAQVGGSAAIQKRRVGGIDSTEGDRVRVGGGTGLMVGDVCVVLGRGCGVGGVVTRREPDFFAGPSSLETLLTTSAQSG